MLSVRLGRTIFLASLILIAATSASEPATPETTKMLIFGPPGVGKGTQSKQLVQRFGVCHVSTGDLLRKEVEEGSKLGRRVKTLMAHGKLVPDALVIRLVTRKLQRVRACRRHGWLLDGFPRTAAQAHALISAGLVPNHIIVLNATNETVVSRTLARASAAVGRGEAPRKDDNAETIRRRLVEYERNRDDTLAALRRYLRVAHIDGGGTQAAVGSAIRRALGGTASAAMSPGAAAEAADAANGASPPPPPPSPPADPPPRKGWVWG